MKAQSEMSKEVIIKADRALFAQMLIIADNRKLRMKRLQQRINNSQRKDLRPRVPRVEEVERGGLTVSQLASPGKPSRDPG